MVGKVLGIVGAAVFAAAAVVAVTDRARARRRHERLERLRRSKGQRGDSGREPDRCRASSVVAAPSEQGAPSHPPSPAPQGPETGDA